jgi:hypothetical protein
MTPDSDIQRPSRHRPYVMPDSSCLAPPADRARPVQLRGYGRCSDRSGGTPDTFCGPHFRFLLRAQEGGLSANGAVLIPGHWTRARYHETHAGVVVCADVETGATAEYKTGNNAVILSRC